ncbi:hypothetical protein Pelo_15258 [Pelomyxa schiedti]|nr:hypothetical protein Pelo_15258 [Pelomyxa schiedti]
MASTEPALPSPPVEATAATAPQPAPPTVPDPQLIEGLLRDAGQAAGLGVQLDTAHDYPGAVDAYRRAAGLLSRVLEFESDPQRSQLISAKVSQYSQRAEVLAGYLGKAPTGMAMTTEQTAATTTEPASAPATTEPQPEATGTAPTGAVPVVLHSALDKVKNLNKEYHIQETITGAASTITNSASQINQNYHITEKVGSVANTSFTKVKEFDQQYKVHERVSGAASTSINALWGWFNQGVSLVTDTVVPAIVGPQNPAAQATVVTSLATATAETTPPPPITSTAPPTLPPTTETTPATTIPTEAPMTTPVPSEHQE